MKHPTRNCLLSGIFALGMTAVPAFMQEKGGEGETGPYEVVSNWPGSLDHPGWTWGSQSGVFAETPDRVFILSRGEVPEKKPVPGGATSVYPPGTPQFGSLCSAGLLSPDSLFLYSIASLPPEERSLRFRPHYHHEVKHSVSIPSSVCSETRQKVEKQVHIVIPEGTKVLTRPGGRVGIVAHAPSAPEHSYRVRFADGGPEESFRRVDLFSYTGTF